MVVNVVLAATQASQGVVPEFPAYIGNVDQEGGVDPPPPGPGGPAPSSLFKSSGKENFPAAGTYTKYTHEYVNAAGAILAVGSPAQNFVRYAEYPGQRLFRKVKFSVNNNPLDEYTAESYLFHQKFRVAPNKAVGWARLVGQEVPQVAVSGLSAIAGQASWSSAVNNLLDDNGAAAIGAPVSAAGTARKMIHVLNGPQTPKLQQPTLDLWIPLLFWFNKDSRLAIASVCIPYGQRFITINVEDQNRILFVAPGNLFLRLTVQEQYADVLALGAGTAAAVDVQRVSTWVTYTPVLARNSVIDKNQSIQNMELYTNNIFVNPEIH